MIIELLDGATFEVRGIPEAELSGLPRIFQVFVGHVDGGEPGDRRAMLGSYRLEQGALRFLPRYPLMRGQRYSAVLDPGDGGGRIVAYFDVPRALAPPTRALRVYP